MGSGIPNPGMIRASHSVEVRTTGRWVTIPGIEVNGDLLITTGQRVKIAKIRGEEMREREIEDPELYIATLTNNRDRLLKADIFTFTQKLPATQRRYSYPMEWESVAAI